MLELKTSDFDIQTLGECRIPSPMPAANFAGDNELVLYHGTLAEIQEYFSSGQQPPAFEMAGTESEFSSIPRSSSAESSPAVDCVQDSTT